MQRDRKTERHIDEGKIKKKQKQDLLTRSMHQ